MAEKTGIAWTDHTFNPWWGCMKVSPGCTNCYAETFANRTGHDIWGPAKTTMRRTFGNGHWHEPLKWQRAAEKERTRRRVFCASMADVFEDHPHVTSERVRLWELIRETPNLDWQLLTKRPENIPGMLPKDWGNGYENVWLGTSFEDQPRADERVPLILKVKARVRFLSGEPLLADVDLTEHLWRARAWGDPGIHWIIVGGESGGQRRPMEIAWLRRIVEDCRTYGIAPFVKQDGAFKPDQRGRIPDDLWIREFPR